MAAPGRAITGVTTNLFGGASNRSPRTCTSLGKFYCQPISSEAGTKVTYKRKTRTFYFVFSRSHLTKKSIIYQPYQIYYAFIDFVYFINFPINLHRTLTFSFTLIQSTQQSLEHPHLPFALVLLTTLGFLPQTILSVVHLACYTRSYIHCVS